MRTLLGLVLALILAAPASGQDTGTYISAPLEWGTAIAWVDANADGKADYCRVLFSGPRGLHALDGRRLRRHDRVGRIDAGYPRRGCGATSTATAAPTTAGASAAAAGASGSRARARPATASSPTRQRRSTGASPRHGARRRHRRRPRRLLPAHRRERPRASAARVHRRARRHVRAGPLDPGGPTGRAWVDFDGDGKADFCRVASGSAPARCRPAAASARRSRPSASTSASAQAAPGPTSTATARPTIAAASATAAPTPLMQCTLSTGTGFGQTFTSGRIEWGADSGLRLGRLRRRRRPRLLPRRRAPRTNQQLFCTLWTPTGLANKRLGPIDWATRPTARGSTTTATARRTTAAASAAAARHDASRARSPTAPRSARSPPAARPTAGARRPAAGDASPRRIVVTLAYAPPTGPLHAAQRQGRPARRDRQGQVPEGLLAQDLHEAQRARHGLAQDARRRPQAPQGGTKITVIVSPPGRDRGGQDAHGPPGPQPADHDPLPAARREEARVR